jgi:hypothetical protein
MPGLEPPSAGVDEILNGTAGGTVASAEVVFTSDAPEALVASAAQRLQDGAAALYKTSGA